MSILHAIHRLHVKLIPWILALWPWSFAMGTPDNYLDKHYCGSAVTSSSLILLIDRIG